MFSMLVGSAFLAMAGTTVTRAEEAQQPLRELPPLLRAVSDEPGVLSLAEGRDLSRRISEVEHDTGVKLIALVVISVAPEGTDIYAQRLINHWRRHTHALDNGRFVFILIAKNDREVRIVPGPDLAWMLKSLAGNEITDIVSKLLRNDRYYEALLMIVNDLERLITNRKRKVHLDKAHSKPAYGLSKGKDQAWRASIVWHTTI